MNIYKKRLVKGVSLIQHRKGPQNQLSQPLTKNKNITVENEMIKWYV